MTNTSAGRNGEGRGLVGRVAGAVTGRVVDAVDPDIVLAHVDMDALVERVDLDAALARVDIQALLDRLDLNGLVERVDLDAAAGADDPQGCDSLRQSVTSTTQSRGSSAQGS